MQALKETLAAGKASPQRRALGSSSGGSRSPGGDSGQEETNLLSSPASVVSIGSIGSETRCVHIVPPRPPGVCLERIVRDFLFLLLFRPCILPVEPLVHGTLRTVGTPCVGLNVIKSCMARVTMVSNILSANIATLCDACHLSGEQRRQGLHATGMTLCQHLVRRPRRESGQLWRGGLARRSVTRGQPHLRSVVHAQPEPQESRAFGDRETPRGLSQ